MRCVLMAVLAIMMLPEIAFAQFKWSDVPVECDAPCKRQAELLVTLDQLTPMRRIESVFGLPYKEAITRDFKITWFQGTHANLILLRSKANAEIIAAAVTTVYHYRSSSYVPTPQLHWTIGGATTFADVTLKEAQTRLAGGCGGRLSNAYGKHALGWTPGCYLGNVGGGKHHSFMFDFSNARCDTAVEDENALLGRMNCSEANKEPAMGHFVLLSESQTKRDFDRALEVAAQLIMYGQVMQPNASPAANFECALVLDNPDRSLSVRAKPSSSAKPVAKVRPGQLLVVPSSQQGPWYRIVNVIQLASNGLREQRKLEGWVHGRYIKLISCSAFNIHDAPNQPWLGTWALKPQFCKDLVVGENEGLMSFTNTKYTAVENFCDIKRVRQDPLGSADDMGKRLWKISLSCFGEGAQYPGSILFAVFDSKMIVIHENGEKIEWAKCPE